MSKRPHQSMQRPRRPTRGDDSPVAPDDTAELAAMEAAMEAVGALYIRDWLNSLTEEERAVYHAELARLEAEAREAGPLTYEPDAQSVSTPIEDAATRAENLRRALSGDDETLAEGDPDGRD